MEVKIKMSREHDDVRMPCKREEDAGYDVYVDPKWFKENSVDGIITMVKGKTLKIPTGLRYVCSKDWYIQMADRGSTSASGLKYGAGIGDSGFRGILNVFTTNVSNKDIVLYDPDIVEEECIDNLKSMFFEVYPINKGIAQFMIKRVYSCEIEEVSPDEILNTPSERKEGMQGSSGK